MRSIDDSSKKRAMIIITKIADEDTGVRDGLRSSVKAKIVYPNPKYTVTTSIPSTMRANF
jgi:hypothetical protein